MKYVSTRNSSDSFKFEDVFIKGLADDGGLFIPKSLNKYSQNDLLKFKNLDKKHTQIVEGDKIKWVYLRDNPYKIDTIGFLDFDLPKKIREFIEKYKTKYKL